MSGEQEWGVMHPDGNMISEHLHGYPFKARVFAQALARELDDECECGDKRPHEVMVRDVQQWRTP